MGINKLSDLIRRFAPDAITVHDLSDFGGWTFYVDTSIMIHQLTAAVNHPKYHPVQGVMHKIARMRVANITPVFVFDGPPPVDKRGRIGGRIKKYPHVFDIVRAALTYSGVGIVDAPSEAEAQAARLCGPRCAVLTTDLDALVFGAPFVVRNVGAGRLECINLARVLAGFKMTQREFVDLCILCGSDYADTAPGVGPVRAYKLMTTGSAAEIRNVLRLVPQYKTARRLFLRPHVDGRGSRGSANIVRTSRPNSGALSELLTRAAAGEFTKI